MIFLVSANYAAQKPAVLAPASLTVEKLVFAQS